MAFVQLLLGLLGVGLVALLARSVEHDLAERRDLHRANYVGSAECRRCHTDHTDSWRRTFHRTMTQAATPTTVQGDFSGASLEYFGVRARMERAEDGGFVLRYRAAAGPERRFAIEKTVGSRRYQQYIARLGDELVRLPLAYHLEEKRWFHMNGAFLTPDPAPTAAGVDSANFERHLTRWNDNCVFCHNVAPNPGKRGDSFDTQVAELGIGCEACHGPGSEHARRNANPLRRFQLHLTERPDPTIVNPSRLPPERAADVCGRCHGQRMTDDVNAFLTRGDPFIPGEDLALYSAPLWRDSVLGGDPHAFEARFWPDGTPRLTAYEYQGMLLSACQQRGALTCTDCHGMHEGDPRGQLREARRGAALCTHCHGELAQPAAQVAHARHGAEPPSCESCHMPAIVYGVLATHPSHRIERPNPARSAEQGRPDACSLCHVEWSRSEAVSAYGRLFEHDRAAASGQPGWSEVESQLIAGDPIERVVAAQALAGASARTLGGADAVARRRALLLDVMENDTYPVVRRFAARALSALTPELAVQLATFVPETPHAARRAFAAGLRARHPFPAPPHDQLAALRAQASERAIEIGE